MIRERMVVLGLALFLGGTAGFAFGESEDSQGSTLSYYDMSLEQLMDIEVSVASVKQVNRRQSPGIVTVITREEILNSGARDLIDLITLYMPGITFAADMEGQVSIGMRGIWSMEGRVLLLIDGQEVNEELFSNTLWGNHYPVDNIAKVEIIRGPGSAMYGGYASVGVISVTTRGVEEDGAWISGVYSQMSHTFAHRNIAGGFGVRDEEDDFGMSLSVVAGEGTRSQRDNVDAFGHSLNMKDRSEMNPTSVNFNLQYKGLDFRTIADRYHLTQIDLWGENFTDRTLEQSYDSYFFDIKYDFEDVFVEGLKLTPEWRYKVQYPWHLLVPEEEYTCEKRTEKMEFILSSDWDINEKLNLISGLEYYNNYVFLPDDPSPYEERFDNGNSRLDTHTFSAHGQLMAFSDLATFIVGGRFDNSNEFGSAFVPRLGVTKVWERWHAKGMYSGTFRTPSGIMPNRVVHGNPNLEPERGTTTEVEIGYEVTEKSIAVVDFFDTQYEDAIQYLPDPTTGEGGYRNSGEFGTRGVEAEYRFRGDRIDFLANYAYYTVTKDDIDTYTAPGDGHVGLPQHRFNAILNCRLTDDFSVHPSLSVFGSRYGYEFDQRSGGLALQRMAPRAIFNVNFRLLELFGRDMEVDFGVHNVFDTTMDYVTGYDGGHAPLPGHSRAFYLRAEYRF